MEDMSGSSDSEEELLNKALLEPEEELLNKALLEPEENTHDCYKYDSEPEKSSCLTRWNWRNIITITCLLLAFLLCNISYSIVGPFLPDEAKDKGASALTIGIIIGCAPFSLVILSPIFGYLLPRIGVLLPIFLGLLLVGTAYVSLAFVLLVPSTWGFIFLAITLRLVEGAGSAMFVTATYATLPKLFPHNVSTMVALIAVAIGFGFAIGPPMGGALYKAGGYKIPFLVVGVSVLCLVIPCALLVRKVGMLHSDGETDEGSRTLSTKTILRISTSLIIVALVVAMILAYFCYGFFNTTLQLFLVDKFNISDEHIGLIFCLAASSSVITSFLLGPVVDRIGHNRWFIILGMTINTVAFFALGLITFIGRWYILLICVSYFFIGIGSVFSVIPVYSDMLTIAKLYTSEADTRAAVAAFVSGIISSSLYLGECSGNMMGGLLTNYFTFPLSAALVGEILLAEVLLLFGVTAIDKINGQKY